MKKTAILLLSACACAAGLSAQDTAPAFPGAEGFARYTTTGGRGGKVIHVTTLEDNNKAGSLRYALNQSGKRTVVFDVSGTIFLNSELKLTRGDVTVAGQTAPGDGICVAGYPFVLSADNVILRYMRFRLGNEHVDKHEGDGLGGMDKKNIIVDHCSVSWSVDECLSVYGNTNETVQWCMVTQSMVNAGHQKGAHGYGGNWGGSGASFHHNLMAHHGSRTPRLGPRPGTQTDERMDLRNNVIYNYGGEGCYGGEGMNVNIVNNLYKPGPATKSGTKGKRIASPGIRTSEYTHHNTPTPNNWDIMWHVWGKLFVEGNVNTQYPDVLADNWENGIYNQIDNSKVDGTFTQTTRDTMRLAEPLPVPPTTTHATRTAYDRVLAYAGASLHRDAYDNMMVADTRDSLWSCNVAGISPGLLNSQNDVQYADGTTGWPVLNQLAAPADTDGDGIPDDWELANGLDPNKLADGASKTIDPRGWYTNLEVYINSLVEDITKAQNEGALTPVEEYFPEYKVASINTVVSPAEPVATEYISLDGRRTLTPAQGVSIQRTTYSDGSVVTSKILTR